MIKSKIHIATYCFITDVILSLWSYFKLTNYDEYLKQVKSITTSPAIQLQVYQMMLQWFTVTVILFLIFHLVVYFYFWKVKVSAVKYVRFYTFTAAVSSLFMIASGFYIGVLPVIIYGASFIATGKILKELNSKTA